MSVGYNPPPNWPAPPDGWMPPAGWSPPPEWGPAPHGWQFWINNAPQTRIEEPPTPPRDQPSDLSEQSKPTEQEETDIPLFGARAKARELAIELRSTREHLKRLGALDVVALDAQRTRLTGEVAQQVERIRIERDEHETSLRNEREKHETSLRKEQEEHEATLSRQGKHATAKIQAQLVKLGEQKEKLVDEIAELKRRVVATEDAEILQEVGLYEYRHPLTDAVGFKDRLDALQAEIKEMARREGRAITAAEGWTVNGSATQGRTMIKNYSKLMLRAYNAEADNLVRALKPYKLESAIDRLNKVTEAIQRLGKTMSMQVAPRYHHLRVQELELTADYREKLALEKEKEREEREQLREERKVQEEIRRERQRLEKERQHYVNVLQSLESSGDLEAADRLRSQLADVEHAIENVDYRAANHRAGYVYVISNLGAFGENMIKVGLTRRLEPLDRIRELGDASVPFRFDVHALFFADDAVSIETAMHERLAGSRVNQVNLRREFFYATPTQARDLLLELAGDLLQFEELPEALEFHQSQTAIHGE